MRRSIIVAWPRRYADEVARLAAALGALELRFEHIGSTAVPGLAAKPVIDILGGIDELGGAGLAIGPIEGLGYEYVPAYETSMPFRRFFRNGRGLRGAEAGAGGALRGRCRRLKTEFIEAALARAAAWRDGWCIDGR